MRWDGKDLMPCASKQMPTGMNFRQFFRRRRAFLQIAWNASTLWKWFFVSPGLQNGPRLDTPNPWRFLASAGAPGYFFGCHVRQPRYCWVQQVTYNRARLLVAYPATWLLFCDFADCLKTPQGSLEILAKSMVMVRLPITKHLLCWSCYCCISAFN